MEFLRKELCKRLGYNTSKLSTEELILQSRNYPIRQFTDLVTNDDIRQDVIQTLRSALPNDKGVTGK